VSAEEGSEAHFHRPDRDNWGIFRDDSVAPEAAAVSVVSMNEKETRTESAVALALRLPVRPGGNKRGLRTQRTRMGKPLLEKHTKLRKLALCGHISAT
jgi:hypothetical protein